MNPHFRMSCPLQHPVEHAVWGDGTAGGRVRQAFFIFKGASTTSPPTPCTRPFSSGFLTKAGPGSYPELICPPPAVPPARLPFRSHIRFINHLQRPRSPIRCRPFLRYPVRGAIAACTNGRDDSAIPIQRKNAGASANHLFWPERPRFRSWNVLK